MKKNVIEKIVIEMMCTADEGYFSADEIVSDDKIIEQIKDVEDLELKDRDGRTLLLNAVCYKREKVVKYLIDRKASVNNADNQGFYPLHVAVMKGDYNITELLLKNGAEVNARNECGNTPLMLMNLNFPIDIVKILPQHGADPTLKNEYDVSALDVFGNIPSFSELLSEYEKQ